MATTLSIDGLIYTLTDWSRESIGERGDMVTVDVTVENPAASLDDSQHLPSVELRDQQGGVYEIDSEAGWSEPLPETSVNATLRFRAPADATALELVLQPGVEEEVTVRLE